MPHHDEMFGIEVLHGHRGMQATPTPVPSPTGEGVTYKRRRAYGGVADTHAGFWHQQRVRACRAMVRAVTDLVLTAPTNFAREGAICRPVVGWGLPHHDEMLGIEVLHGHRGMQSNPRVPAPTGEGLHTSVVGRMAAQPTRAGFWHRQHVCACGTHPTNDRYVNLFLPLVPR